MLRARKRFLIILCIPLLGPALANAAEPPRAVACNATGAGSGGESAGGAARWDGITGQEWSALELLGRPVLDGTSITIVFHDDGRVSGNAGTNNYTGVYRRRGPDGLEVSDLGATRMYLDIPPGRMQQETEYLMALQSIDRFTVDDDELLLWDGPNQSIRYTRSP